MTRQSIPWLAATARLMAFALILISPLGAQSAPAASANPALGTGPDGRYPFTAADVHFMTGMISHHAQAVQMAKWAPTHEASKSLQIYCGRVAMAQTAEIGLMQLWLKNRNQPAPDPFAKHDMAGMSMPGMDMGGMKMGEMMPGMLSPAQMDSLDKSRGVEFDRLFLTYMIQHHLGAIQMVDTLFATHGAGMDDIVNKFATDVYADQSTEINRMQQMLDALPPRSGQR